MSKLSYAILPSMKKEYYSYETFKNDTNSLLQRLPKEYNTIVAITRGGLSFAQALSEALNIRNLQTIQAQLYHEEKKGEKITIIDNTNLQNCKKVLVVDDIADSGETFQAVMQHLEQKYPSCNFESTTLFYKKSSIYEPTYWVREATAWIDFFWEIDFKSDAVL